MATATSLQKSSVKPPCYDCKSFNGVAALVLNDPMADSLSAALRRSGLKHPFLEAIRNDLIGNTPEDDYGDDAKDTPAYTYNYFRSCGLLLLNPAGSEMLSQAISLSGEDVPPHLWALHFHLKNVEEKSAEPDAPDRINGLRIENWADYRFFYGVHIVILNEIAADALASAIERSEIKHDSLTTLAQELSGVPQEELDDGNDNVPSFTYSHFCKNGALMLNRASSALLSQAIFMSGNGRPVPEHMLTLQNCLKGRYKRKEDHAA